ncbi:hypothetical protein K1719_039929 [Acacia pycnantha]|nr:hypothetical protein K1719_039929 [Acacia pycnantha]
MEHIEIQVQNPPQPVQNPPQPVQVQNPQQPVQVQNPRHVDIRKAAKLTATIFLVATTYQAMLSPPDGFWPPNSPESDTLPPSLAVQEVAGKSVLDTTNPVEFGFFLGLNIMIFFLSLVIINDLNL